MTEEKRIEMLVMQTLGKLKIPIELKTEKDIKLEYYQDQLQRVLLSIAHAEFNIATLSEFPLDKTITNEKKDPFGQVIGTSIKTVEEVLNAAKEDLKDSLTTKKVIEKLIKDLGKK